LLFVLLARFHTMQPCDANMLAEIEARGAVSHDAAQVTAEVEVAAVATPPCPNHEAAKARCADPTLNEAIDCVSQSVAAEHICVTVTDMVGSQHTISVQPQGTVHDLKQAVFKKAGVPVLAQSLSVGDRVLDADECLLNASLPQQEDGVYVTLIRQCLDEHAEWLSGWERSALTGSHAGWLEFHHLQAELRWPSIGRRISPEMIAKLATSAQDFLKLPTDFLQDDRFVWFVLTKLKSESFAQIKSMFLLCIHNRIRESAQPQEDAIVKLALEVDALLVVQLEPQLMTSRELVLIALESSGMVLAMLSQDYQADKDIVLKAVRVSGQALAFASDDMKADNDVVLAAVQQTGFSLEYASTELKASMEVVSIAIKQNGDALQFAAPELRESREVVAAAVQRSGGRAEALRAASDSLRADFDIVATALRKTPFAYEYAATSLQADDELRRYALVVVLDPSVHYKDSRSTEFVHSACVERLAHVLERNNPNRLNIGPTLLAYMMQHTALAVAHVTFNPQTYSGLDSTRTNVEVAYAAIRQDWKLFLTAPYSIRADLKIQVAAAAQNVSAIQFCIPSDRHRVREALKGLLKDESSPSSLITKSSGAEH